MNIIKRIVLSKPRLNHHAKTTFYTTPVYNFKDKDVHIIYINMAYITIYIFM